MRIKVIEEIRSEDFVESVELATADHWVPIWETFKIVKEPSALDTWVIVCEERSPGAELLEC